MMTSVDQIVANALDLAGAGLVPAALDDDFAVLNTLNVIDSMMLELAQSGKQTLGYKITFTVSANTNTGTVNVSALALGEKFCRYRRLATDKWTVLDVVSDIEDLTEKENRDERSICFQGAGATVTYLLSFMPNQDMQIELWGKSVGAEISNLSAAAPLPPEFGLAVSYRVADVVLNQLLITDGQKYQPFVIAQKASLARESSRLDFMWRAYRTMPEDAERSQRVRPYDIGEDLAGSFDDIETVLPSNQVS